MVNRNDIPEMDEFQHCCVGDLGARTPLRPKALAIITAR
jgi:hypothetical protein